VEDVAKEFGVRHVRDVATNQRGTPLVDSIFGVAQRESKNELLCYINTDIILLKDFSNAVSIVSNLPGKFLVIGRRWNVDIRDNIDFSDALWETYLRDYCKSQGWLLGPFGSDYFLFTRGLWDKIPRFILGRLRWDSWLVHSVVERGLSLIDATPIITAVHQNHDYLHMGLEMTTKDRPWQRNVMKNSPAILDNPEIEYNLNLIGRGVRLFDSLFYATHVLTPSGLNSPFGKEQLLHRIDKLATFCIRNRIAKRLLYLLSRFVRLLTI
jgi:hypothetical protein